jgi:Asparagine synthase
VRSRRTEWATEEFRQAARRGSSNYDVGWTKYKSGSARALYKNLRSSSWVSTMDYNNKWIGEGGIDVTSPFLDRDLLEFLMQVPGEFHLWGGVPKALLRRAMHGVLPPEIENRKWKADFQHLEETTLMKNSTQLIDVIKGDLLGERFGLVDVTKLRKHVEDVQRRLNTEPGAAWSLEGVVGLEIWLRTFFS